MSILSRPILAALLIAASSLPALAWEVLEDWTDPIGGRSYTAAGTVNDEGISVTIFRDTDNRVRAVYSIPASSFDQLPNEGRVLAIRPGENDVVEVKAAIVDRGPTEGARSDGKNIRALIWHGSEPSPTRGTLRNILDSDTLYARFYTDTGGTIDTTWSLEGAPKTIATAIQIRVDAAPEAVAWANLQTELLISSTKRCNRDMQCLGALPPCMEMLNSMEDVDAFNRCVERVAP